MKLLLLALAVIVLPYNLCSQNKPAINPAEQLLVQMELDWSQADVKKDAAALKRILAEDWAGIDFTGAVMTKEDVLRDLRSDATATQTTEIKEMKVRIFGNTGLVSGTEVEKSHYQGKDSSGVYIWTDVFVLRQGRWQAVSSQSTKVRGPEGAKPFARLNTTGHRRNL